MIEDATALLERRDLPTWEQDAAVRRELERLGEDVHRYRVAAGYDQAKAAKLSALVNERADRINAFLRGHRHGGPGYNGWGMASRGHSYEF